MAIPRNAPCPCGSGRKYKKCCLGKMDPRTRRRLTIITTLMVLVTVAVGASVGWFSTTRDGILAGCTGAILIGIYLAVRNPPQSRSRFGADRIDFGR